MTPRKAGISGKWSGTWGMKCEIARAPFPLPRISGYKRHRSPHNLFKHILMAITCPRCGAAFDVTLFQFGHRVRCDCGAWVDLGRGHVLAGPDSQKETHKMSEKAIGTVTHYFGKIQVAGIRISDGTLRVGDRIHVQGHTSDFTQSIDSIQIDGKPVDQAGPGDEIGIKVVEHAREHDAVYKILDD